MHFTNQILTAFEQVFVYIEKVIIFNHMRRLNFSGNSLYSQTLFTNYYYSKITE